MANYFKGLTLPEGTTRQDVITNMTVQGFVPLPLNMSLIDDEWYYAEGESSAKMDKNIGDALFVAHVNVASLGGELAGFNVPAQITRASMLESMASRGLAEALPDGLTLDSTNEEVWVYEGIDGTDVVHLLREHGDTLLQSHARELMLFQQNALPESVL